MLQFAMRFGLPFVDWFFNFFTNLLLHHYMSSMKFDEVILELAKEF